MSSLLDIIQIVRTFTGCSQTEAHPVAVAVCRDPEALELLLAAAARCGASVAGAGIGGIVAVNGATLGALPIAALGVGVAAVSASKAQRFCGEMLERGFASVPPDVKEHLR